MEGDLEVPCAQRWKKSRHINIEEVDKKEENEEEVEYVRDRDDDDDLGSKNVKEVSTL